MRVFVTTPFRMRFGRKDTMNLPPILEGESLTRLMQGAAAGAVVAMIVGFSWGGWTPNRDVAEACAKVPGEKK